MDKQLNSCFFYAELQIQTDEFYNMEEILLNTLLQGVFRYTYYIGNHDRISISLKQWQLGSKKHLTLWSSAFVIKNLFILKK